MDETVRMLASKGIAQAPTADGLVCTNPLLPDGRCAILSDDDGRITVRLCRPGGSGPSRIVAGADAAGAVAGWLTGLAAARHSRGLTQAELAAAAGIAPRGSADTKPAASATPPTSPPARWTGLPGRSTWTWATCTGS